MRERLLKGLLGMMISFLVVLALLACYMYFAGSFPESNETKGKSIGLVDITNPEHALEHGVTGYLEITLPSDSPSHLVVDRGGAINITILLHFVSHTPTVTETQVNIDPKSPWGSKIEYRDVNFREFVSYNPSGTITTKAGEPMPVIMTISVPEDLPSYIEKIPLGAMGIQYNFLRDELGGNEVVVR